MLRRFQTLPDSGRGARVQRTFSRVFLSLRMAIIESSLICSQIDLYASRQQGSFIRLSNSLFDLFSLICYSRMSSINGATTLCHGLWQ